MQNVIVQRGTEDEFPIAFTLEGNLNSNNLLVMLHGGGMNHHEQGYYSTFDQDGNPIKRVINGKLRTVLTKQHIGNYDRIAGELETINSDVLIVRIDLRNHGSSLLPNGEMDTRDSSIIRMATDVADVIEYIEQNHEIMHIHLMGTCLGGLISQCLATGLIHSENKSYLSKIRSLFLNCSLSFANLCTTDPIDSFNYRKTMAILKGPEGFQFTKMKGMFEGKKTIFEASKHLDLPERVASLQIPIKYVYGRNDRLLPEKSSLEIVNRMLKINSNIDVCALDMTNSHGFADHCLWTPQCSDSLLYLAIDFFSKQSEKTRNVR